MDGCDLIIKEELTADNEKLSKELADKRLRLNNTGNIAEAALEIHNVMQAAQAAAEHYLEEIQIRGDCEYQRILKEANEKAAVMIEEAQRAAAALPQRFRLPLQEKCHCGCLGQYRSG